MANKGLIERGFENARVRSDQFLTSKGYIRRQAWVNPVLADADGLLNDAADNQTHTTFLNTIDYARKLTAVLSGAGTEELIFTGTNIRDEVITETLACNGNTPVVTLKAFKTLTSIVFPNTAGGRTLDVGWGDQLGLDRCMDGDNVILLTAAGVYEATRPTVVFNASDVSKNTLDPNTTLDGAVDFIAYFISTEIINRA